MQTKMTELLGIQHPIMQGGMQHLGTPELASAVSNAGGLGTINVTIYPELEDFRQAVRQMKALTQKPFAVNVSIPPDVNPGDKTADYLRICAEEGVGIIELAGGNPTPFAPIIKGYGMKLIIKMAALKHAKKAQSVGADLVTIVGYEVAGHPGMGELSSMVLADRVSHELNIPVMLGGGVADGYGLAGALGLGCAGVVMGTRFVASTEAVISAAHKQWIVDHSEGDTITCQRSIRNMVRVANTASAQACLEMERKGATLQELMAVISGKNSKAAYQSGEVEKGLFPVGQTVGLIHNVKSCQEIIDEIMAQAEAQIASVSAMVK
ncbi:nitronate monooxygenase [Pseudoflavonifractor phocaeensis]|nr:nitronate monooxygenase [Pseudoflavonifractor phocaeensis]MBM6937921.1 nitronate monooxygenase [Pseudoflavonifractor phocaeensis]